MLSLRKPPKLGQKTPPAVYLPSGINSNDHSIILCPHQQEYDQCISYDINSNQYDKDNALLAMPKQDKYNIYENMQHYAAVNKLTNELYIYAFNKIYICNLNDNIKHSQKKWKTVIPETNDYHIFCLLDIESMIFSYNHNNKSILHILSRKRKYFQYDPDSNKLSSFSLYQSNNFDSAHYLLFNNYLQQIYILRVNNDHIETIDVNKEYENGARIGVQSEEIKLPQQLMDFNYCGGFRALLAFDGRIFLVFSLYEKKIYCMDIANNIGKWNIGCWSGLNEKYLGYLSLVLTKYNDIHFVNISSNTYHKSLSLWSVLPDTILERYGIPLVNGYIKSIIMNDLIPKDVVMLMSSYL